MRPKPYALGATQEKWRLEAKAHDHFVQELQSNIRVYSYGQGPAILLNHGWASRAHQLSPLIAPLLERHFRATLLAPHYDMRAEFHRWALTLKLPTSLLDAYIALTDTSTLLKSLFPLPSFSANPFQNVLDDLGTMVEEAIRLDLYKDPAWEQAIVDELNRQRD